MNGLRLIGSVFFLTLVAATASGATQKPYQPVGAPADPKAPAQWNRYHDYAEATALMKRMVAAHPNLARLQSLGKSYGGREMWLLAVTNSKTGPDRGKPAFWIDGAIHANEIQGTEVALYTAWYLLEMYGRHDAVTRLVDERAFYFVPMMSPDSRDDHMHKPNTSSSPRAGQRPVDDDRDGLVDEDGPDDLDGDGQITQMRRRNPNGRWKVHPKYPQLMIQAEPDERGEYDLLGLEGYDNDGDGLVNEDGVGFYDPNRDWPRLWQPGYVQSGAYRYPFSLVENRLVGQFVLDHPNIAGAQSYHNSGGLILRGPGNNDDAYSAPDTAVYDAIAAKGVRMLPAYDYKTCATGLYEVYGGEFDWFFGMRGIFSFTNELFTTENYFRRELENRNEGVEEFDKYLLLGQGAVAWHAVDHPQYGKIEVGGKKKQWGRQPPSFLLEEECHRNMAFTLYHADQMPQVAIQSVEVVPKAGRLVEVTAAIINQKLIPTHADVDLRRGVTPPDVATIGGAGVKVIAALQSGEPLFRDAKEQKHQPGEVRIANIPGMGAVYVRWLVHGQGPYTINIRSIKGGSAQVRSGS
jgi:murein tripeptide amidase MpaA